ncbi:ribosomal protein S18 acetylase RimI-like enzyme [Chryseobacterium sp. H1D6B]|uniref:GNAT family N-acetyltransferase n=1 Tax=Chryseobacterium sp. H1D6B TaxID=2940588 RepID=UPI0015CB567A|nr:GNAT family N-acetyltransferase [Chryseobacterium sp. H1D6B]MDH6251083.1 ribosomal protein S18 acetylase RimI-like enzyme [Chryseobacterium sp. H1D6B]
MEFKNLENIDIQELLSVFNHSFSDYLIHFHLTQEQLKSKINTEKIDKSLSVGAFQSGQMVSFILHAEKIEDGQRIIYNAGTGIIPDYRGQGLVRKMYDHILPVLQDRKADILTLEVLEENQPAVRAYTNLGFSITRKLLCFKGNIQCKEKDSDILIQEMKNPQWEKFRSFWDIQPSWQNSVMVLERMNEDCVILGAYKKEKLAGYAVYNPLTRKVHQISVDKIHRKKGIGTKLFGAIKQINEGEAVSINNVDDTSENTSQFLTAMGLHNWVSQFEMAYKIQIQELQ